MKWEEDEVGGGALEPAAATQDSESEKKAPQRVECQTSKKRAAARAK